MNSVSPNLVLLAAGVEVLVIDDQSHPSPEPPATETLTADCGSEEAAEALARFKPNAVLHLASKGGVQVAARDPAGHARRSLASTIALYDAAIKAGAKRLVSASSGGTVYGDSKKLPAPETARRSRPARCTACTMASPTRPRCSRSAPEPMCMCKPTRSSP